MTEPLRIDRHDTTAIVTLDRPAARNALNADLRAALPRTMAELASDANRRTAAFVSAVVLDKAFGLAQGFERRQPLPRHATMASPLTRMATC